MSCEIGDRGHLSYPCRFARNQLVPLAADEPTFRRAPLLGLGPWTVEAGVPGGLTRLSLRDNATPRSRLKFTPSLPLNPISTASLLLRPPLFTTHGTTHSPLILSLQLLVNATCNWRGGGGWGGLSLNHHPCPKGLIFMMVQLKDFPLLNCRQEKKIK